MLTEELELRWRELSAEVARRMAQWRAQHPRATFQEIETEVDMELGALRARMLEDAAMVSQVADLRGKPAEQYPCCPTCGTRLQYCTQEKRTLQTQQGQAVTLERSYAVCPHCGQAFFPPR